MDLHVGTGEGILFSDLFNIEDLQNLQDTFSETNGVASIITHPDGSPITKPSNFTRLCSNIIRNTEKGCANCYKSDAIIGRHNPSGPIIQPCLSGGLWDAGASITVGDKHIANWMIGQVRNSKLNEKEILTYADEIKANKKDFKEALKEVPEMSLEQFSKVANMLFVFARELSAKAYSNWQLKIQNQEREKATEKLEYNNTRLQSLVNILQYESDQIQDFLDHALDELIKITDSKIGYIYFYNEEKQEFILNTWSKDVMKECAVSNPQTIYCLEKTGLWGEAVRQRKPIFNNNFEAYHPHKKGYPEGHVHLKKFLTIPVFFNNKIVAVAGVANKTNDYDQTDVLQMSLLMNSVWKTTERIKSDLALQESEERWRRAIADSPVPIMIHDEEGRILQISEGWSRYSGYTINDIPTLADWTEKAFGERTGLKKDYFDQLFDINETTKNGEWIINAKDGSKRTWDFQTTPLGKTYQGKRVLQSMAIDITESKQAEQNLQESEQRLQYVLKGSQLGYWDWNLETNVVKRNERWAEMLGYKLDDIEYSVKQWIDFIHPDDQEKATKSVQDHINGLTSMHRIEYRMKTKDGQYKWILDQAQAVKWDENGKVIRMSGTHIDVTDRRLAEEALSLEQKFSESLLDSLPGIFYLYSYPEMRLVRWNKNHETLFGYSHEELKNMAIEKWHRPDAKMIVWNAMKDVIEKGHNMIEAPLYTKDGHPIPFILTGVRIDVQEKQYVMGVGFDITERKQAEIELREKEVQYRNLADSGMALIWTSGIDKLCNYFNEPWMKFTGRTLEQELGNGWTEGVHPDDFDHCLNTYVTAFDKHESFEMEYRLHHKSGEYRWLLDKGTPNYNSNGEFIGYIGHCFDISELKRAEAEIVNQNEELLKINAEKDKFFSIIAHDLRSPFNSFLGLTQIMAERLHSLTMDQLQKIAENMRDSATNLFRLLENLLQWSRIQRGLVPFEPDKIELSPLVNESIEMVLEPIKNKNIELTIDIPDKLKIIGDQNILQTIIRNLVSNAMKFTPKDGKINISAKVGPENNIEFAVKDTGIGMSQPIVANLFRIDVQTNRKGTEGEASTGLGLIICKELISKHGGTLWVNSEEGKGSTFHFSIPQAN